MTMPSIPTRFRTRPSRRQLFAGGAAAAAAAVAVPTLGQAPASALDLPPRNVPEGEQGPGSVPGSTVTRLGNVTGPGRTSDYLLERTDIGIPVTAPSGRTLVFFGDSFAEWTGGIQFSPAALAAEPGQPLDRRLEWSGAVGGDVTRQLVPSYGAEFSTKLPSDVLTVGDTMYMQLWALTGWPNLHHTEIWKSTDDGETWEHTGVEWGADFHDQTFWLWTWEAHDDGFAYIYSQKYRASTLYMWRVPLDRIEDQDAYEPWGFTDDGGWEWGKPPTPILDMGEGGALGEGSLRRFGDRWMYTSVINGKLQAYLMDDPWADLRAIEPVVLLEGADYEDESASRMAALYLGGIVPGGQLDDFQMLVSQWVQTPETEEVGGWPYWVENFRFQNFF